MDAKKPWLSKTLWVAAICAIAPLIPGVGPIISANPEIVGMAVGAIFAVLRVTTDKSLSL